MSAVDLLPCPFCGGKAEYKLAYGVRCVDCNAGVPGRGDDLSPWNRRAPVSAGKVTALEWGDGKFSGQPAWFADTAFGCLMVVDHLIHGNGIQAYDVAGESIGIFTDVPAAKAAAQADYEARMLSQFELGDGWQGIESAPKDGTTVLLHGLQHYPSIDAGCPVTVMGHWTEYNGAGWVWHGPVATTFTHWMPLPAAPASLPQGEDRG